MIMRSLFIIMLGLIYCSGYTQIINFPDPNFKIALLLTKSVDSNGDGFADIDAVVQPPKIRTKLQTIIKNKTSVLSLRWQG